MISRHVLLLLALLYPLCLVAQGGDPFAGSAQTQIRSVLLNQMEAWNRHDLDAFMNGYWNSPELTFFSGDTVTKGWQPTLERYRKTYQSGGAEMGKLEFSDLQISVLSSDGAFVRGRWHLAMSNGKEPHGLFTLVFRRFPQGQGWLIIHDHTSAAP